MRYSPVLLTGVLAVSAGFLAGRFSAPAASAEDSQVAEAAQLAAGRSGRSDRQTSEAAARGGRPGQSHGSFDQAAKEALSHTLLSKRLAQWARVLARMGPEDAPGIHALLKAEQAAGRDVGAEMKSFWETWCSFDRAAAWVYAEENGGHADAESVLKAWAMIDPAGAERIYERLGDSPLAEGVIEGILHGLAESDPALVAAFVARLGEGRQEAAAVHVTGSMINRMGNVEAQKWFDEQQGAVSTGFHKEAARVPMESLSRSDPEQVEKFALERLDQPWAANRDEQHFVAMMNQRQGGSPWEYIGAALEKLPQAEDPISLPKYSAQRQPDEALEWFRANPEHPSAAYVAGGTAQALINRGRPEEAAALISSIRDPEVLHWLDDSP